MVGNQTENLIFYTMKNDPETVRALLEMDGPQAVEDWAEKRVEAAMRAAERSGLDSLEAEQAMCSNLMPMEEELSLDQEEAALKAWKKIRLSKQEVDRMDQFLPSGIPSELYEELTEP